MIILAIDTSCDDTSVAVVEQKNKQIKILSSIVSSQIKIHSPYGGVYPMLAKRAHQKNLVPTLTQSLKKAGLLKVQNSKCKVQSCSLKLKVLEKILQRDEVLLEKTIKFLEKYEKPKVDAIAITNGPGLEPCLWQGVNFAKALAFWWDLPIVPVNHIKAHLSANWLSSISKNPNTEYRIPKFPAVGLVASGGHTELIYMPKIGQYKLIGSTRDDAAGECFDKTARILGLPYPGGPAIAALAKCSAPLLGPKPRGGADALPRPMLHSKDFDFSFSGLKTAVLYDFQSQKKSVRESENYKIAMAKEIQQSIIDVLIAKTLKASKQFNAKPIITGGGVMANRELRKQLKVQSAKCKVNFFVPEKSLCLDNGAMVGASALINKQKPTSWQKIRVDGNLNIC
ncbi:MAG: tRNA (adenosine(37)-N6)-threonylcarbamoyltransferase complex transferase subunit TsaD [bacterium]